MKRIFGLGPPREIAPRELSLAEIEAWLATVDTSIPDAALATCPRCNGWGITPKHTCCAFCDGRGTTTLGAWREDLRARIEAATS
jgi:hypothetical protein